VCVLVQLRAAALAQASAPGYKLQDLAGGKGSFLLHTWSRSAADMRANGFSPAAEAVGDHAFRLKGLVDQYPKLISQAKVIGLCEQGSLSYANLEEPHKSMGVRLSKTRLVAALSAGKGSALAFVSQWPDHVSIDSCVINPSYLLASEEAEATLLQHVARESITAGCDRIQLRPTFQVDGDFFYARCGFFPGDGDDDSSEGNERMLYYDPSRIPSDDAELGAAESSAIREPAS